MTLRNIFVVPFTSGHASEVARVSSVVPVCLKI
jgi:hypothetical protein